MRRTLLPFTNLSSLCAILLAAAVSGCGQADVKAPADAAGAAGPVRFRATVYEVHMAPAKMGELDAKALAAKGATAAAFAAELEAVGKTKALYQLDQTVNPAKDRAMVGTRAPMVTSTRVGPDGKAVSSVTYQPLGAIFKFFSDPAKATRTRLDLQLEVEISAMVDTAVELTPGTKAPAVRNYSLTCTGPVDLGRPLVFFSIDASTKDADGNAVAYVCRAVMGDTAP